ncbi:MAG: hypothetical protein ABR584_12215 [Candidatus Baltobacteraceae bacterium]
MAIVKIRALNGAWIGYSSTGQLQPDIKPGTTFLIGPDIFAPNWLLNRPNGGADDLDLGPETVVRTLRYEPRNRNGTLLVIVLDGKYKGRTGWASIPGAEHVPNDGVYGLVDPQSQ